MGLKEDVKQAAKQQLIKNKENVNIPKSVDLGLGRKSTYGYDGEGRPVNEGCEDDSLDDQRLNMS